MNTENETVVGRDTSTIAGRQFQNEPAINVIPKEEVDERVEKVFHLLWNTLVKSFGPYGAPTMIVNYPAHHITKDGYTIMKNLSMNASETLVDQAIANMAEDICGRLNYAVGDGTTSAVIATHTIYNRYMQSAENLRKNYGMLPRDIIKIFNKLKTKIIEKLHEKVIPINSDDPDELYQNIYRVVFISSNGDAEIAEMIATLYKDLRYPAIGCELATDGKTKMSQIYGYQNSITLNDWLYINSDNQTMEVENADIIIFATKITKAVYDKILVPLNEECRQRGRNLIVAAPYYDENTLMQTIRRDLNNEYNKTKKINMVLTTYRASSAHNRKLIEDFAMLTNTIVIDKALERSIMENLDAGYAITQVFNMDFRHIRGTKVLLYCPALPDKAIAKMEGEAMPDGWQPFDLIDDSINLGFVRSASLGLRHSLFKDFEYSPERYSSVLAEAKDELKRLTEQYKKMGTFNLAVTEAQKRVNNLMLKMGLIEVGGDSELSQKLQKDQVDDSVKAAASAFEYGVVSGCNLNLIQCITELVDDPSLTDNEKFLCQILRDGFRDVYGSVLGNAFADKHASELFLTQLYEGGPTINKVLPDDVMKPLYEKYQKDSYVPNIHELLIDASILSGKVFDVSTKKYSNDIINSVRTDEEILIATIDLLSLLIVENQMVITGRANF